MPQVDFYVLDREDQQSRLQFVCRLLNKIQPLKQNVTVLLDNQSIAEQLEQLLWEYPPESFVPHEISSTEASGISIQIPFSSDQKTTPVCINIRSRAPSEIDQYQRLVEIVCQDPEVLKTTREKYKFYRQQNYPLQSHPISANVL